MLTASCPCRAVLPLHPRAVLCRELYVPAPTEVEMSLAFVSADATGDPIVVLCCTSFLPQGDARQLALFEKVGAGWERGHVFVFRRLP